uniref:Uncharacterized protein n=1 Tax=Salix viminalis TaxID=40686 RepID=A0A6N2K8D2_SALVM
MHSGGKERLVRLTKSDPFSRERLVARFRRRRFGLIRRLRIERLMGSWINSLAYQLLTQSESVWVRTYCLGGDGGGE